jgi:hypothetical protein
VPKSKARSRSKSKAGEFFTVTGVDTFDGTDWDEGRFDTLDKAREHCSGRTKGQQMMKMYIYDRLGRCVGSFGSY